MQLFELFFLLLLAVAIMMAYRGRGDFQTKRRREDEWTSHELTSDPDAPFERRWIAIPAGVWHQGVVGDRHWTVVSFHTVPEEELIEERPDPDDSRGLRRKTYLAQGEAPNNQR